MKLVSLVSLDFHLIFILIANTPRDIREIPLEIPENYQRNSREIPREVPQEIPEKYPEKY